VRRREPVLAQQRHQRGGEHHLALRGGRLQLLREAAAGELLADVDEPRVEVDVAPAEAERLADAEPRVGEELEADASPARVREEPGEVGAPCSTAARRGSARRSGSSRRTSTMPRGR